jgi:hypothetical protein
VSNGPSVVAEKTERNEELIDMSRTIMGKPLDLKLLQMSLRLGGLITVMIGAAHLFFPEMGYDQTVPAGMEPEIRAHFYYLATYAIAAFLLSLGSLSLWFSRLLHVPSAIVVSVVLAALWLIRFGLELAFPVTIGLFVVVQPTVIILPVVAVMALLYTASVLVSCPRLFKAAEQAAEQR